MPNLKEDNPQFPERSKGSFLKAAVAATPLTIGVTAAMRGVSTDGSIKAPREAGIDQAMRHLANREYKGPPIPSTEDVNRFMNKQPGDLSRKAWEWATQSVDPYTRDRMLNYTEGIENMTGAETRSAISQTVTGNQSAAMSRIWRKFQGNLGKLEAQQSRFGSLPVFNRVEDLTGFAQQRTIPLATSMPEPFYKRVQSIAQSFGAKQRSYGFTRPEVASEGFGVWNTIFNTKVGNVQIQVPQIVNGVMLEGSDLQTRRIAPDVLHVGTSGKMTRMGRSEFFLKEFEESIAPDIGVRLKTQRDVEQAVKQLKGKIFGELEAVPNVVAEGRTAAQAQREALRGKAIDIVMGEDVRRGNLEYQPGFRRPTAAEVGSVMSSPKGRAMGLTGGVSPKGLSQGRVSTVDWERLHRFAPDYSRRPEQGYREFQATEKTMKNLGQSKFGQKFRQLEMESANAAYENVPRPKLKATYIDPKRHAGLMESIAMGEGEAIARARKIALMEFEESKVVKLMEARGDIADFENIKSGELLGINQEGKTFNLPRNADITNVRRITDGSLQVEYMKRHQLRHGDKIFGGAKALLLARKDREFKKISRKLGLRNNAADLFISMDELKKNKSLHKTQMLSSLDELVTGTWNAQAASREWLKESASHEAWIRNAMKSAVQELDLSAKEFGNVFGAVPYVLGLDDNKMADFLAKAMGVTKKDSAGIHKFASYWDALRSGTSGGMADIAYGGPRLDVGGLGSLEPRAFDILKGGPLGKEGEAISKEFIERLAITNPEARTAHEELGKTISSMTGGKVNVTGKAIYEKGQSFQNFIEEGGGIIKPGQGMSDIYVPGADTMRAMRPFETASGVQVRGNVSNIYHDIASKVDLFQGEDLTSKEFQKEMESSANLLREEWASGGKGAGSLSRGKMTGSRFLRGVSAMSAGASTAIQETDVAGITKGRFESMYQDLIDSNLYGDQKDELIDMRKRFLAGEDVGGILGRHPNTGDYSYQPTKIRMLPGEDDLIVLPEVKQKIKIRTSGYGKFKEELLTLGHLPGVRGDKDADPYFISLLSPKNEKSVRERLLAPDSLYRQRYAEHQIRTQIFKPPKAKASKGLSTVGTMIANVEKLGVGDKWIAPLSVEMTAGKQALTTFGQGQAAADARFLLEWLENVPISAKHLSASKAAGGGLQSLMESITNSMQRRNDTGLQGNVASIVKGNETAKAMLTGNIFLDRGSAQEVSRNLNVKMGQELKGVNVPSAIKELMRVLKESDASGETRRVELRSGRGQRATIKEMRELAFSATKNNTGVFSKVSSAMTSVSNRLGQAGRGVLKHHKTVGLGFAGSLALAAVLSSPPQMVGPGREKIPDARRYMNKRKAANRMKPEDLHPPGQPVGQPTVPQMVRNQTVRLSMNQPRHTSMRATVHAGPNTNTQAMAVGLSGVDGSIGVHLRDSRAALHPREIANKLL